jgi:hypothetical protein
MMYKPHPKATSHNQNRSSDLKKSTYRENASANERKSAAAALNSASVFGRTENSTRK